MEKDSDNSSSNDTVGGNTENQDYEHIGEFHAELILAQRLEILEKMEKLQQALDTNKSKLIQIENVIFSDAISDPEPPDTVYPISPMASPIHESQDLSQDISEITNFPPFLAGHLNLSEVTYDPSAALQTVFKGFNDASSQRASYGETEVYERDINSPLFSTSSEESYEGKGKEAENPKFRYKKRSKPAVSSSEAPSQLKPVKPSKEASVTPETKTLESPSSKTDNIRISPAVKRKEPDPGEGCSTGFSNLFRNLADDNDDLKIAKKLKFDDDDRASLQCPTIATLVSQKNYERSDSYKCIVQSLIDQRRKEREELALPSTSGLSGVVRYASSSEESWLTSGSEDVPQSEKTSISTSAPVSEREQSSSLTNVSDLSELFGSISDEASPSPPEKS